jgi:CubicO group peptidase (beta-lactamase class C family)
VLPADAYWAAGHDGQRVVVVPSAGVVVVRLGFDPALEGDELGIEQLVADVVQALGQG